MSIKTVVVAYEPRAKKLAKQIEATANEMELKGYEFLTFSITESAKAILVFRDKNPAAPTPEATEDDSTESAK
ncbi:MAG: hypothetical protein ACI3XG_09905 [Faecousia sp.]